MIPLANHFATFQRLNNSISHNRQSARRRFVWWAWTNWDYPSRTLKRKTQYSHQFFRNHHRRNARFISLLFHHDGIKTTSFATNLNRITPAKLSLRWRTSRQSWIWFDVNNSPGTALGNMPVKKKMAIHDDIWENPTDEQLSSAFVIRIAQKSASHQTMSRLTSGQRQLRMKIP